MRYLIIFMLLFTPLYAKDIAQPPVLNKEDRALLDYLKMVADNYNTPSITTTAPNGNVKAVKGHIIIYDTGVGFQLWVNTDGNKTWSKIGP